MRKKAFSLAAMTLIVLSGRTAAAKDIQSDLGKTYAQITSDNPALYREYSRPEDGRWYLTDGKIGYYFEYMYLPEPEIDPDAVVTSVVITYNDAYMEYSLGQSMTVNATYADEESFMSGMGYKKLLETTDMKHYWTDGTHLVIVTRGPWSGAAQIEYSLISES